MNETKNKKFDLKSFLLRTLTDPVLWYTVLIMTALMYHYRNRDTDRTDDLGYVYALGWGLCSLFIGWIIFRIFDILKPLGINRLQKLPGGIGIVADDIVAAIYSNITLKVLGVCLSCV